MKKKLTVAGKVKWNLIDLRNNEVRFVDNKEWVRKGWWCGQRRLDGGVTVAGSGLTVVVVGEEEERFFFLVVVGGLLRKNKRMVVCRGRW